MLAMDWNYLSSGPIFGFLCENLIGTPIVMTIISRPHFGTLSFKKKSMGHHSSTFWIEVTDR
jgi:hypothetical protein